MITSQSSDINLSNPNNERVAVRGAERQFYYLILAEPTNFDANLIFSFKKSLNMYR